MTGGSGPATTLTELVVDAARYGDQPCFSIVSSDDSRIESMLTVRDAIDGAKRVAGALRSAGVEPGARVVFAAPPSCAWVTAFLGTIFAGGVAVPVNHRYRSRELAALISACDPAVVLVDDETEEAVRAALETRSETRSMHLTRDELQSAEPIEPEPREPSDLAVILHTSGTTGGPKGVERTQGQYAAFVQRWSAHTMQPGDRVLNFLPLYHQAGLVCSFLSAFISGIPTFHVDRFNRETFWPTVDTHGLTWAVLMQPVPRYLLDDAAGGPNQSHALEWIVATVTPEDWVRFQERFGVAVQSSYGSTETTILRIAGGRTSGPVSADRIRGPLGGALCGRAPEWWGEIRVVTEDGEILGTEQPGFIEVRGETVLRRYLGNPDATRDGFTPDNWFRSGDYGYFSAAGDLYFLDRISGLIRRSGENIAPREVEELLEEHPSVAEAAVIGIPDELRGQEIAAFVVPRPGMSLSEDELFGFCQEHLASFKVPRYIESRAELPHTPTFKVQRAALELSPAAVDRFAVGGASRSAKRLAEQVQTEPGTR